LASLLLALVGAFTLIGPLLAVACGLIAMRQIARAPQRLAGRGLAKAGVGLGLAFSVVSVAAFFWADWIGLDGLVRGLEWAHKIDYSGPLRDTQDDFRGGGFSLSRPSARWGKFGQPNTTSGDKEDRVVFVHLREDAYILVREGGTNGQDALETCRFTAEEMLMASPLLRRLGKLGHQDAFPKLNEKAGSYKQIPDTEILEIQLDVVLGGIPRTMLVRIQRMGNRLFVVAGLTRTHRFARLEETFRQALDSFKIEQ
jgi:hypothetical protein